MSSTPVTTPPAREDFATRMARHLIMEADPAGISDPKKPEPGTAAVAPSEPAPNPANEPAAEPLIGVAIGDMDFSAKKKPVEPAATPDPTPAPSPEPKPAEPKKKIALEKPEPKPAPALATARAPEPTPTETPKTLDEIAGVKLTDDEREYLETVRYAEGKDSNLKGALDREVKRIQAFADFAKKWKQEHPGEPIDKTDEGYKTLVTDHPSTIARSDVKRLERERFRDEVLSNVKKDFEAERQATERKFREVEVTPRVEAKVKEDEASFAQHIGDESFASALEKKGVEGRLARAHKQEAVSDVRTYRRLSEGLDQFDPNDPVQLKLVKLMDSAADFFKKHGIGNGQADLIRDGKKFVSKREFSQIARTDPAALEKVWTFSTDEMASIILGNQAAKMRAEIASLREDLAADGYSPSQSKPSGSAPAPAPRAPLPDETPSPRSIVSPSGGGGPAASPSAPSLSRFERRLIGEPNGSA